MLIRVVAALVEFDVTSWQIYSQSHAKYLMHASHAIGDTSHWKGLVLGSLSGGLFPTMKLTVRRSMPKEIVSGGLFERGGQ